MEKPERDEHYEENFDSLLWKLIKQQADNRDISYVQAAGEVLPKYQQGIRYRDTEFENTVKRKREKELAELIDGHKQREGKSKEVQ